MKNFKWLLLAFIPMIASCDDDEPGENGGQSEKIVTQQTLESIERNFPHKRVSKIYNCGYQAEYEPELMDSIVYEGKLLTKYYHNSDGDNSFQLEWSKSKITISRRGIPLYYAYLGDNGMVDSIRALKRESLCVLKYNEQGNIISCITECDGDTRREGYSTWENGNLVSYRSVLIESGQVKSDYTTTIEYSSLENPGRILMSDAFYGLTVGTGDSRYANALYYAGVLGQEPINVPYSKSSDVKYDSEGYISELVKFNTYLYFYE